MSESEYPVGAPAPSSISVNDAIDFLVDTLQKSKNFIKDVSTEGVDMAQEGVEEINTLLDQLIDKAQELKG